MTTFVVKRVREGELPCNFTLSGSIENIQLGLERMVLDSQQVALPSFDVRQDRLEVVAINSVRFHDTQLVLVDGQVQLVTGELDKIEGNVSPDDVIRSQPKTTGKRPTLEIKVVPYRGQADIWKLRGDLYEH